MEKSPRSGEDGGTDPPLLTREELKEASYEVRSDKATVLAAVKRDGLALRYACPDLRVDKEVVGEAVRQNGQALELAHTKLRADKDLVLEAVQRNFALELTHISLRGDPDVVLHAVKQNPFALRHASEPLRADKEFMLQALAVSGILFQFASKALQQDVEVVLEAVKQNGHALQFAGSGHRASRDIVLEAIKQNGYAWKYAAEPLQADKEILLLAARCLKNDDARYNFDGALQAIKDRGVPEEAISVPIAIRGEDAPIATVSMSRKPIGSGDVSDGESFVCEVSLLSGTYFSCGLPDCSDVGERVVTTIGGLAYKIVEELPKHTQAANINRMFMNLQTSEDCGAEIVSPFDWNQPLSDYLASPRTS